MGLAAPIRRLWARLWLRGSQFSGRYSNLKALYAIEDPWDLGSDREQARYQTMNALVREFAPDCKQLLELGSGEGLQTRHLLSVSRQVTGVEISPLAVERSKVRCPGVEFHAGRAEDAPTLLAGRRFDVITAFEVLYYAEEPARILAGLQAMTSTILVSNYRDKANQMAHLFEGPGWRRLDDLDIENVNWRVDVWRAQDGAGET